MISFSNTPVAKRTRSQWDLYWQVQAQGLKRRKSDEVKKTTVVYKSSVDECDEEEKPTHENNGSQVPSRSTEQLEKSNNLDESSNNVSKGSGVPSISAVKVEKSNDFNEFSLDESKDEESNREEPLHLSSDESDSIESTEITLTESSPESDTQRYSVDSSDDSDSDSDSDYTVSIPEKGSKGSCRSSRRKLNEVKTADKSSKDHKIGSGFPSKSTVKLDNLDESSVVELSEDEESSGEESHLSLKETDGLEEIGNNITSGSKGYGSLSPFKTAILTDIVYLSDDSDSDDTDAILDEQEDEDLQESCKYHLESQNNTNTYSFQSTEDDESESDTDDCVFSLLDSRQNQPSSKKQTPIKHVKEKDYHSVHKTKIKKVDKNVKDELRDINDDEKTNAKGIVHEKSNANVKIKCRYTKVDKANVVKKSKKGGRKDDGGSVNAMLDSIIFGKESVHEKEGDDCLPLKFRFDDSEDESSIQETNDFGAKGLFEEMDFALDCEEIGSYKTPTVKNQEKDNDDTETSQMKLCESGDHRDIYLEEQTGMRCRLCGAVLLESRYVIPKLANYAADRSKRSYVFDEQQFGSYEHLHFKDSEINHLDVCKQTKGTVWELIPTTIQARLYPHQQEGFEFLWKNLAGTIDLSRLHKLGPRGGGCIISHAPGTGKTLLTIVFMDSFLRRFPRCCPVIIAPASMLLTWEQEFKKWHVGFSFINLNNSELFCKEMINGSLTNSRRQKDMIRAMKIKSWSNGGSVLGVSYNLYGKLARDTKLKNSIVEKMGNVLLEMPGLVVLDEGHTPRNKNSNIWNTLLRLKTKNRVILSGTPFQNNFRELFNTLRLVRPATASNEKNFADMIHQDKRKKSRGGSTSEDIEKLKVIIRPFVHVHKGDILESKLPGLKQIVVLLNPSPFQKGFIENLGNFSSTFEHEHKVALVSVHPSLILHCSLSKKEEKSANKELEKMRLYPEHGVKTRFVMELVRLSISLHEKILIFSQYIQPLELLKDQLIHAFGWEVEREIMVIKGNTHQKLRQTIINDFNDPNSKVKVLLASTKCCSEGIHLFGASRVVLLDVVWNPSVEKQAISRAYRLGQKKVVYTYLLMTAGTTEEDKYDRQVEKGWLAEKIFSSRVMVGDEPVKKVNMDGIDVHDKVLERMVDHRELKEMFKQIRRVENQTRI